MGDRIVATMGFFASGLAIALAIVGAPATGHWNISWPITMALLLVSSISMIAFSGRRHQWFDHDRGSVLAFLAGSGIIIIGVVILAWEQPEAFLFGSVVLGTGSLVVGFGYAEFRRLPGTTVARVIRVVSMSVIVIIVGFFIAAGFLVIPDLVTDELSTVGASAAEQIALGAGFVVTAIGFMIISGRGIRYLDVMKPNRRDCYWMVGGTILIVGTAIIVGGLYSILGIEGAEHQIERRAREYDLAILLVGMPLTLVATATGEELLYRNVVQKYLTEHLKTISAILLSSLLFALAHFAAFVAAQPLNIVVSLSLIFLLSIVLAVAYERTKNVIVPIVIHGSYNILVFALWYFQLGG